MPPLDVYRPSSGTVPTRTDVPERYRWDLSSICQDWDDWARSYRRLEGAIDAFALLRGTLANGPADLLAALRAMDDIGALSYRVWYYAALQFDEDQRRNDISAKRQQVQIVFARQQQASAWFNPEVLAISLETIRQWMQADEALAVYRFAVESLFHEQEHVLDERGERLLSYASRFGSAPSDSYSALTTADRKFPTITLGSGESVTLTYGQYRSEEHTSELQSQ